MFRTKIVQALGAIALLAITSGVAEAHAHLVRADPAVNVSMKGSPRMLHATFSESLVAAFSNLSLVTAKGKVVAIGKTMVDPKDRTTLVATVPQPLAPGTYVIRWQAVSADSHRKTGQYSFRVR
jgi:methionine-rich copper-binding protein CopC